MPLLNYTTRTAVDKSIAQIQKALIKAGATSFQQDFDEKGNVSAVSFKITIPHPDDRSQYVPISYRLPADVPAVMQVLKNQRVEGRYQGEEHARRVAWRILKDWIEAQMAIVETKMVTLPQVMLPYATDESGTTLWEKVAANPRLLLGGGDS
jgi:hypothetical protein